MKLIKFYIKRYGFRTHNRKFLQIASALEQANQTIIRVYLLVKLYDLPEMESKISYEQRTGVTIRRAIAHVVADWWESILERDG